jgi:uncharacterized protein DUF3606
MIAEDGIALEIAARGARDLYSLLQVGDKQRLERELALKVNPIRVLPRLFLLVRRRRHNSSVQRSDGRTKARPRPEQAHELAYWSAKLGVSRDELRKAVQAAGAMVRRYSG